MFYYLAKFTSKIFKNTIKYMVQHGIMHQLIFEFYYFVRLDKKMLL